MNNSKLIRPQARQVILVELELESPGFEWKFRCVDALPAPFVRACDDFGRIGAVQNQPSKRGAYEF